MEFAKFMSSGLGRGIRIVAGLVLIAIGIFVMNGIGGIIVAIIGAVPFLAGLLDVCVIGARVPWNTIQGRRSPCRLAGIITPIANSCVFAGR